jgi:transcriptional regulator with XRE-family HTH domain
MKTTYDLIDDLKRKLGFRFDNELAEYMGWKGSQLSRYRTRASAFSEETAMRVAQILEVDPAPIVAAMKAQSCTRPEAKKLWERIARKVATVAIVGVAASLGAPAPSIAGELSAPGPQYYVNRRRWLLALILGPDDAPAPA